MRTQWPAPASRTYARRTVLRGTFLKKILNDFQSSIENFHQKVRAQHPRERGKPIFERQIMFTIFDIQFDILIRDAACGGAESVILIYGLDRAASNAY